MLMPLHYKDLREELDNILWHYRVPRKFFYRLQDLRSYLINEVEIHSVEDNVKILRALEIIREIMPQDRSEISV